MGYTKYYIIWLVMFIASLAAMFFIEPEYQWWAFAHFILSFIGLMATFIAVFTDKNRTK